MHDSRLAEFTLVTKTNGSSVIAHNPLVATAPIKTPPVNLSAKAQQPIRRDQVLPSRTLMRRRRR